MNYPKEILCLKNEYLRFFVRRFPFEIFKSIFKPHLENKRYRYILKEITEVVSIFNILCNLIRKYKINNNFILYELTSGDALFSHFVAKNFPAAKIVAVDVKFSDEYRINNKSKFLDNLFFLERNIFEFNIIENANFVVSIHACGKLSEIVIELASKSSDFLILVPCCVGSEEYDRWKTENKIVNNFFNAIDNEYYKWCFYLAEYAKSKKFLISFKKDDKMLSKRNIIIIGKRI